MTCEFHNDIPPHVPNLNRQSELKYTIWAQVASTAGEEGAEQANVCPDCGRVGGALQCVQSGAGGSANLRCTHVLTGGMFVLCFGRSLGVFS